MLGFSRKAAEYTWTAVLVLLLLLLVYALRSTLFVFVLALLFAYLLYPLVELLNRALPGRRMRGVALGLAYVIFIAVVTLVGTQIGSRVVDQAQALSKRLPEMMAKWEEPSESVSPNVNDLKAQIVANIRREIAQRANDLIHVL